MTLIQVASKRMETRDVFFRALSSAQLAGKARWGMYVKAKSYDVVSVRAND